MVKLPFDANFYLFCEDDDVYVSGEFDFCQNSKFCSNIYSFISKDSLASIVVKKNGYIPISDVEKSTLADLLINNFDVTVEFRFDLDGSISPTSLIVSKSFDFYSKENVFDAAAVTGVGCAGFDALPAGFIDVDKYNFFRKDGKCVSREYIIENINDLFVVRKTYWTHYDAENIIFPAAKFLMSNVFNKKFDFKFLNVERDYY